MTLRRVAEQLARNRVIRKTLPSGWGSATLYCSPDNNLRILRPGPKAWDQKLLAFVDGFVKPDAVVWDVGANMGVFAFPAATRAKFVLAVEADPFNVALLERSRNANPTLNVAVLGAAVTEAPGIAKLRLSQRGRAANSLEGAHESSQAGGWRGVATTPAITLDMLLEHFPKPDFVKIDIEGAEHLATRGAVSLIRQGATFLIETAIANRDEVTERFLAQGYELFSADAGAGKLTPVRPGEKFVELLAVPPAAASR